MKQPNDAARDLWAQIFERAAALPNTALHKPDDGHPARVFTPQDRDLISQCDVLCSQPTRPLDHDHQRHEEHPNEQYHSNRIIDVLYPNQPDEVFKRDRATSGGSLPSLMGDVMKTDFRRVLFSAICLSSSVHITQAAEPYASIGVGFAAERIDASVSGINHPTRCDRLLYSDPMTAPGDAACTDNTVRHISNGSFKLGEALVGSASFGIAWDKARIEAEFLGRTHGGDTVLLSTRSDNPALEDKASEWSSDNPPYHRISDFRAQQLFLNVYYDFALNSVWTPYIGAGVGLARVRTNYTLSFQRRTLADGYVAAVGGNPDRPEEWQLAAAGTLSLLDTKLGDETFGYQIVAGMERALSDRVSTFLTVRWTWFDDMSDKDVWDSIRSHRPVQADGITPFTTDQALNGVGGFAATVGVRYSF